MGRTDVRVSEPISDLLYCISNSMRRSMLGSLVEYNELSFSELKRHCGLASKYDTTGTFTYHLSELNRVGALTRTGNAYRVTEMGRRMYGIVRLLEHQSRFLREREERGGENTMVKKDEMVVKSASKKDNPKVAELIASYYYEEASRDYEVPKEYFEYRKRSIDFTLGITGRNLVYIAEEKDKAVGVCWWSIIEKENSVGGVDKEAFLEHLYVRPGHDIEGISEQLMKSTLQILLDEERITILNVWYDMDEPLKESFYAKFDMRQPENLKLLMYVAQWARPSWPPKKMK